MNRLVAFRFVFFTSIQLWEKLLPAVQKHIFLSKLHFIFIDCTMSAVLEHLICVVTVSLPLSKCGFWRKMGGFLKNECELKAGFRAAVARDFFGVGDG